LVKFRSMAAMPAALMFSGVWKSGSPRLSGMVSRPAAFRSAAHLFMAFVADALKLCIRSARRSGAAASITPGVARFAASIMAGLRPWAATDTLALPISHETW